MSATCKGTLTTWQIGKRAGTSAMAAAASGAKLVCSFHGGSGPTPQFGNPGISSRGITRTTTTTTIRSHPVYHPMTTWSLQAVRPSAEAQGLGQISGSSSDNQPQPQQQRPVRQAAAAKPDSTWQSQGMSLESSPRYSARRPLGDIMCDLNRNVPEALLKRITVDHGFQLKYIPWFHANRLLNYYAPGWNGEVRNVTFSPDNKTVTVVYRVTIHGADGVVWRESSGTASGSDNGYGDPVQKAEGMAFRRACARFGLGLHLYHDDKT